MKLRYLTELYFFIFSATNLDNMKHLYLFLMLPFLVQSQFINFPDPNFKAALLTSPTQPVAMNQAGLPVNIDSNADGEIDVAEALLIYELKFAPTASIDLVEFSDMTGISYFSNLKKLDFSTHPVGVFDPQAFPNLEDLRFTATNLTSLNLSNLIHLKKIIGPGAELSSINVLGCTSLESISLQNNNLTAIDLTGLTTLDEFAVHGNDISALDFSTNVNLLRVYLGENELSTLDFSMCPNLYYIECGSNNLTSLNVTGNPLGTLYCEFNQLTSIDLSNKPNMTHLFCQNNQITSLDMTGKPNLMMVYVHNNNLTTLEVPQAHMYCSIKCFDNELIYLNVKTGWSNSSLEFYGNPNLQYICADEVALSGIQTKINQYGYTNCHVNSYCSFVPGGTNYIVEGTATFDLGGDGCDVTDNVMSNLKFKRQSGSTVSYTFTNLNGNYSMPLPQGNQTITPILENPAYFNVSPASFSVYLPDEEENPVQQPFCISPNGVHHDLEVTVLPVNVLRPGFDATYQVVYKNKGNQPQSGTIGFNYDEAALDFVSANPAPAVQTSGQVLWGFSNLLPFETRSAYVTINANAPTETPPLSGGEIVQLAGWSSGFTPEETPNDNAFYLNQTVVNSFDPNDKTCLEGSVVSTNKIGDYVHYLVRFENTGTFAAENIVVRDVIDTAKFDVTTLQPISGSHPFSTRISNTNLVEFIFEDINLPFDGANNDGFVAFKIKTKPTLVVGDTFSNAVNIYFDYNFPILTNTATTTIQLLGTPDFEFADAFTLYPNPVGVVLNIRPKSDNAIQSVQIYNMLGQLVVTAIGNVESVDVSGLSAGSYFLKTTTDKGNAVTKFIKQ